MMEIFEGNIFVHYILIFANCSQSRVTGSRSNPESWAIRSNTKFSRNVVNVSAGLKHWSSTTFAVLSSISKTKYLLRPCHYTQLNQYSLKCTLTVSGYLCSPQGESLFSPCFSQRSLIMCSRLQPVSTQPTRPAHREVFHHITHVQT